MPLPFCLPITQIKAGHRLAFSSVQGSSDALLITQYFQKYRSTLPLLAIICAHAADVRRLQQEIAFFDPTIRVRLLPDWETLPYDMLSPHQDLVSDRLSTIYELSQGGCDLVLCAATTALYRMLPTDFMAATSFFFKQGQVLDEDKLKQQLICAAYERVNQVLRPGEYAVRGGLFDLFPMGSAVPYRIDLFENIIESLRAFNPDTQRSLYSVSEIRILPRHEFPFDEIARATFCTRWREVFPLKANTKTTISPVYQDVQSAVPHAGIEYYLPLFFSRPLATLFDYFPKATQIVCVGNVQQSIAQFTQDTRTRYQFLSHDPARPLLAPTDLFLTEEEFFSAIKPLAKLILTQETQDWAQTLSPLAQSIAASGSSPLDALAAWLEQMAQQQIRVLISAESIGRREILAQLMHEKPIQVQVIESLDEFLQHSLPHALMLAPLAKGFILPTVKIAFLTETELYGRVYHYARKKQEQQNLVDNIVKDLSELKIDDPVVHSQYGIGRYKGLVMMGLDEGETEFLHLEYAKHSTLYVPVAQLHLISRFSSASSEHIPLHTLGLGQWEKIKRKAAQQIRDTAAELLNLYARRATRAGFAFSFPKKEYAQFAENFGFEETPDQTSAINAVIQDMLSAKPMDRLICGDVGFGKTEVALRAAFIAVLGGKQVALLVPTTLLAEQHYQTFCDRFVHWPVKIAELSRFRSKKEITAVLEGMRLGQIDIVIGTHKLLSQDVHFKRLGLVIIDEEHRFGVRQKEKLKIICSEVDTLALTATPIPRTLGLALEGLRDFSVIATAPQKRLAIKTFICQEEPSLLREAILRELKRGGQVYFLHNEVDTIQSRQEILSTLIPEARIAVAHGQMHERELERVMRDFISQQANILLCTTIIETGIDVPNSNTILVHRADKLGLAQLHQLRGRVGRSHHQAYAYLLVPNFKNLTPHAQRRLEAIQQMEELGSGFYLAMQDLEIRGVGEILGDKQAGEIQEIGFQLYTHMLNQSIDALKAGREPDLSAPLVATTEINLHTAAILPNHYCPDVQERLSLYKRLASAKHLEELNILTEEIIDRFGKLLPAAQVLIETHRLRCLAEPLGVLKINATEQRISIQFTAHPPIDPLRFIQLIQNHPQMKFSVHHQLIIEQKTETLEQRTQCIRHTLQELATVPEQKVKNRGPA